MFGIGALTLRRRLAELNEARRREVRHGDPLAAVQGEGPRVVGQDVARELRRAHTDRGEIDAGALEEELVPAAGDPEVEVDAAVDGGAVDQARSPGLPAADEDLAVTHDRVGDHELALVHLSPERPAAPIHDDRPVDLAQLEHAVAGRGRGRQGRRNGDEATEQDEAEPAHRHEQSFPLNYASNEGYVRSFVPGGLIPSSGCMT